MRLDKWRQTQKSRTGTFRHMTQKDLSNLLTQCGLPVCKQTIYNWEAGLSFPTRKYLDALKGLTDNEVTANDFTF
ncbi:hypothetical protein LCGC14_1797600 [marine sediment metagenome]|uniref:HTH cro/C1-type domain-containing protein n=1 Tax=marine sediment metagenome TaxID=412755 RepID=A0A0F9GQN8_9ZZZZ